MALKATAYQSVQFERSLAASALATVLPVCLDEADKEGIKRGKKGVCAGDDEKMGWEMVGRGGGG